MLKTIKVPAGNRFVIYIPATWQDGSPVVEEELTDLQVILRNSAKVTFDATVEVAGSNFVVTPADLLPLGSYDIHVSGRQAGREFALPLNNAFAVCQWANDANFADTITLNAVVLVGSAYTDEEIEALKEQYRTAIEAADDAREAAEAAREEYIAKAEALDDIAQQSTLIQGVTDIRSDIANIDIDTSALATEATATANKEEILAKLDELPTVVEQAQQIGVLQEKVDAFDEQVAGVYDYLKEVAGEGVMPAVEDINHIEETIETIVDGIVSVPLTEMTVPNSSDVTVVDYSHILLTGNNTSNMFNQCRFLSSIKAPKCTNAVTNMASMFYYCNSLQYLDVSGLDTSNVTHMQSMFRSSSLLQELDLSNFETSNVTNMVFIFEECASLQSLDLSNFDTSNVTSFQNIFSGCSSLIWLDLRGWKAPSITGMGAMFGNCRNLQTLVGDATYEEVVADDIKVFDGLNVTVTNSYLLQTIVDRASLRAIINGLADRTGDSACTFKMDATMLAKLSAEDIAVATAKNWTLI